MSDLQHERSATTYTISEGAWGRGDSTSDLRVTITRDSKGVAHIGLSHRSLTPAAVERLHELVTASGDIPK